MRTLLLGPLYPITTTTRLAQRSLLAQAELFLEAGVRLFQVRDKELDDRTLLDQLAKIKTLCDESGAQLIVNDRVDLAMAVGAHGVHLGQGDLPVSTVRRLMGPETIIGLSTHNPSQFLDAQDVDVDYVALGPIFRTSTKLDAEPPLGPQVLADLIHAKRHPVVAIGGITLQNVLSVWSSGADSVAVISDLHIDVDPLQQIQRYHAIYPL